MRSPLSQALFSFGTVYLVVLALAISAMLSNGIPPSSAIPMLMKGLAFLAVSLLAGPITLLVASPHQFISAFLVATIAIVLVAFQLYWQTKATRALGVIGSLLWILSGLGLQT